MMEIIRDLKTERLKELNAALESARLARATMSGWPPCKNAYALEELMGNLAREISGLLNAPDSIVVPKEA